MLHPRAGLIKLAILVLSHPLRVISALKGLIGEIANFGSVNTFTEGDDSGVAFSARLVLSDLCYSSPRAFLSEGALKTQRKGAGGSRRD